MKLEKLFVKIAAFIVKTGRMLAFVVVEGKRGVLSICFCWPFLCAIHQTKEMCFFWPHRFAILCSFSCNCVHVGSFQVEPQHPPSVRNVFHNQVNSSAYSSLFHLHPNTSIMFTMVSFILCRLYFFVGCPFVVCRLHHTEHISTRENELTIIIIIILLLLLLWLLLL